MRASDYQREKGLAGAATGVAAPAPGKLTPTPPDILGPYYRPGSPFRARLTDAPTLTLTGRVIDTNGNPVVENCYLDFWQADPSGKYDEHGPGFRGLQHVGDLLGHYCLETVEPGHYDISDPGDPQPHEFRCPHIHVKVWVGGKDVLTTQLYFPGDAFNSHDACFDSRRVIQFAPGNTSVGNFDLVIPAH